MTRSAGGRNSTGASATMRPLLIATDASTTSLAVTTRPPLTIRSTARALIDRRGGPRYGPPHPPSLGRAPAQPWRASGLTQDVSSVVVGGPDMAPQPLQAKGATPPSDSPGQRSDAPRRSRGAPRARHRMSHRG